MSSCENAKQTSSEIEHVDWSTGTGSGHHYANVRFGSTCSSQASQSSGDICRICHCESDPQNPLLTPCYCSGSLKYVHQTCLQRWLTASETNSCELCKFPFIMHTKIKPFNEWRSLDISGIERRRLCCSVLFHCAAALCVIWSLCVLIERAADDVQRGMINWPFWTKLAVVTVGLTGGIVFMYIQCKAYLHLCHRWKARNRILLIQNAPEKVHPLTPPSPATDCRILQRAGDARLQQHQQQQQQQQHQQGCGNISIEAHPSSAAAVSGGGAMCAGVGGYGGGPAGLGGGLYLGADGTEHGHHHHHHHQHQGHHANGRGGGGGAQLDVMQPGDLDLVDPLLLMAGAGVDGGGGGGLSGGDGGSTTSSVGMLQAHHQHRHNQHSLALQQGHQQGHLLAPHQQQTLMHGSSQQQQQQQHAPQLSAAGAIGLGGQGLGQVAVAANIECSQSQHSQSYERDWPLDDVVSQISSFRPCPQGSGSMTPFHNVLEHSSEGEDGDGGLVSSGGDGSRQDLSFSGSGDQKAPSIGSGVSSAVANGLGGFAYRPHHHHHHHHHQHASISSSSQQQQPHYANSIFLENRDILNDDDNASTLGLGSLVDDGYPSTSMAAAVAAAAAVTSSSSSSTTKLHSNYRHSGGGDSRTASPTRAAAAAHQRHSHSPPQDNDSGGGRSGDGDDVLEKFLGADLRRYSDTKLLASASLDDATDAVDDFGLDGGQAIHPMGQVPQPQPMGTRYAALRHQLLKQHSDTPAARRSGGRGGGGGDAVLDMALPMSPLSPHPSYAVPLATRRSRYQQREQQAPYAAMRHSMDAMEAAIVDGGVHPIARRTGGTGTGPGGAAGGGGLAMANRNNMNAAGGGAGGVAQGADGTTRLFFKSLPNLSSSCENLLKK